MTSGSRVVALAALLAARTAAAQPEPPPLAAVRGDAEIARELASITQDPTIVVDGPKIRAVAQALMVEGVKQLGAHAYDQALANFLDAYSKFPSPRILLDIGSTLRDMGRSADAANTYERFVREPGGARDRVAEVTPLLAQLDAMLTLLTVHVSPHGAEVSIDGGPFLAVGDTLVTRVRPGLHLVRLQHAGRSAEITVNGFENERKELTLELPTPTATATATATGSSAPPAQVHAWLTTGTSYTSPSPGERRVRTGYQGDEILPIFHLEDLPPPPVLPDPQEPIDSGVLAMLRIDGKGRGVAAGFGLALAAAQAIDLELAVLRSEQWGAYAGIRYRVLTGLVRPYLAGGVPMFLYTNDRDVTNATELAVGLRAAAGIEVRVNGHLSLHADVGYEHFFHLEGTAFDANLLVPTVAAVGRL